MPYSMDNVPDKIKAMPKHAQEIFIAAFNSAIEQDPDDEGKANAIAYAAVKRDYEQDDEGAWRKKKSASSELSVIKQANGKYRWVAFTSSSYIDRDGEIVSQAALEQDAAQMNTTKEFGALDWWHTPLKLGACDFSEMHGRISIESGLFDDDFIGERLTAHAKEFGVSRAFYHPVDEPDAQGVYHNIRTYARAILPRGKESNLLTSVFVGKEENEMLEDKIKAFVRKLGGDKAAEEKVAALLATAESTDKAAQEAGLKFKEAQSFAPVEPPADGKPAETKPADEKPIGEQPGMFVADMTPEEFDAHVTKAATAILTPLVESVKALIEGLGNTQAVALKESGAAIAKQFEAVVTKQAELDKRLAELEGLTPRGYRATQDPQTKVTDATKEKAPHGDGKKNDFESFLANLGMPVA